MQNIPWKITPNGSVEKERAATNETLLTLVSFYIE